MNLTISGLIGTGGEEVAICLEQKYGYRRIGAEIVAKAAELYRAKSKSDGKKIFYDETMDIKGDLSSATLQLYLDVMPEALVNKGFSCHLSREQSDMFETLRKVTKDTFDSEDKVIFMGRCAGHILRREHKCINLLTIDTPENCRARIIEMLGIHNEQELKKLIRETNSRRINFYEMFTGFEWGQAENFDYCLTPSVLGIEKTANLIVEIIAQHR